MPEFEPTNLPHVLLDSAIAQHNPQKYRTQNKQRTTSSCNSTLYESLSPSEHYKYFMKYVLNSDRVPDAVLLTLYCERNKTFKWSRWGTEVLYSSIFVFLCCRDVV